MKRIVRLFSAFLAVMLLPAALSLPVYAAEGSMTLTTSIPCTVTLSIGDHGAVTTGGLTYTGDASFKADPDTVLTYTITPDSGCKISSVLYNGENVTESVSGGVYTAPALTGNASLTVVFAPPPHVHTWDSGVIVKQASGGEPGQIKYTCTGCGEARYVPIPPRLSPQTGDKSHAALWAGLMCLAVTGIAALIISGRKRKAR